VNPVTSTVQDAQV